MSLLSRQRGQIVVYGATGYTGRLVAAELLDAGADFAIAGRDPAKLDRLADQLGRPIPRHAVTLDDAEGLRAALSRAAVVIDCAGPFTRHGEPVLRAAVETGTHYLDTTGEQPYIRMAFDRYGPRAERAATAVIPAMGFDYAPGDMIASLTARGMGEIDELVIAYWASGFLPTRGTALSAIEMLKGGDVEWRAPDWIPAPGTIGRGSFDFGPPLGRRAMVRYPAGEQITVPRHVRAGEIRTLLTASTRAPGPLAARLAPLVARPVEIAVRTPIGGLLGALVARLPEGPGERARAAARFEIVCEARSAERVRRGFVRGRDVYGLTAAMVAAGARIAAARGFRGRGALAPAQAFDAGPFLARFERFGVEWGSRDKRIPEDAGAAR